jgi:glutamate racemase
MKIGICDYGIGGIGLYKLIRSKTTADIIYFSDSGYTPYGKVHEPELKERLDKVINYFSTLGVSHVAVACNAASTVIPKSQNIIGIIEHGINLVFTTNPNEIAVVGGIRTVESESYKNPFEKMGIQTIQRTAQQLSIKIERGDIDSEELDEDIKSIFEPLKKSKYILLACTHYPAIENRIRSITKNSTLLNPVEEMSRWIFSNWPKLSGNSTVKWITTGNAELMKFAASRSFKVKIDEIEKITL